MVVVVLAAVVTVAVVVSPVALAVVSVVDLPVVAHPLNHAATTVAPKNSVAVAPLPVVVAHLKVALHSKAVRLLKVAHRLTVALLSVHRSSVHLTTVPTKVASMPAALARRTLAAPVLATVHLLRTALVLMPPVRVLLALPVALPAQVAPASRVLLTVRPVLPVRHQRVAVIAKD